MKRFKAVVIGGTGYGGAEMIRRLLIHPDVELTLVVAVDHVGELLGAVHPPLTGRSELRFENVPPAEAARGADVALLGLPHKVSALHAPAILATGAKVVDMSGDFRLRDAAAYARYYGATPLPDEPVMPTTWTTPDSSPARASGSRPSSMVVAKQPGEATARAVRIAARFNSGRP